MEALKTAVLASFDADDCVRTEAERFAMWVLIESTIVSAVPSSDTLSSVVRPANRLFVPYPLLDAVTVPEARRR